LPIKSKKSVWGRLANVGTLPINLKNLKKNVGTSSCKMPPLRKARIFIKRRGPRNTVNFWSAIG